MNKLLIPNGGMPFTGDDLLFMQDALRNAPEILMRHLSLVTPYNDGSLVLEGVNLSTGSGNVILTPGFVALENEICEFPGATAVGAASQQDQWWIVKDVTYDPVGNDIFADLVAKDTYEVRRAKVVNSVGVPEPGAIRFDLLRSYRLVDAYTPLVGDMTNGWTAATLSVHRWYRTVSFRGFVFPGTDNTPCFTLPVGFRPSQPKIFVGGDGDYTNNIGVRIEVSDLGQVQVTSNGSLVAGCSLDPVVYFTL